MRTKHTYKQTNGMHRDDNKRSVKLYNTCGVYFYHYVPLESTSSKAYRCWAWSYMYTNVGLQRRWKVKSIWIPFDIIRN